MRIEKVELRDFRNYADESVELVPGVNLIVGRNAQGKTNLLEAVCCLGGLGSPRSPDGALVRHGAERAVLHAVIIRRGRAHSVDLELQPGRGARALIDKNRTPTLSSLTELAPTVFFGPDELALVKGSPEQRRRFLDDLVVKLRPGRGTVRRDFERAQRQRNALLKSAPRGRRDELPTLDVWDESFARTGARLTAMRLSALADLAPMAEQRYGSIAGAGTLDLTYESSWLADQDPQDEDLLYKSLMAALERNRAREIERGVSIEGPQRDDVAVRLGEPGDLYDARSFASQGDQRTASLALKLAEHDLLSASLGEAPVLLLDDVFSELDGPRRGWLGETIAVVDQVLISAADPGAATTVPAGRVLEVSAGKLLQRG